MPTTCQNFTNSPNPNLNPNPTFNLQGKYLRLTIVAVAFYKDFNLCKSSIESIESIDCSISQLTNSQSQSKSLPPENEYLYFSML